MSLLIVHHDPLVGLDRLERSLADRDLDLVHHDAAATPWPDPAAHAGILVLGGRQSVADLDDLPPFVPDELAFLRAAEDVGTPVLGLCLGAQLLAVAHGGEVGRRETPEVAMVAVHRTDPGREDDVTAGWPDGAPSLAHHEDEVVRLPEDAVQLLVGSDGPTMWRLGTSHATQLHPEAGVDTLESWLHARDESLAARAGVAHDDLLERATLLDPQARAAGTSLVLRWVDGLDRD